MMCPLWFYATTFWTFKYHLSLFETHLLNIFFGCIASWSRTLYLERKVEWVDWVESKTIKGQLISKCPFSVQNTKEISALVSKKGWIKKYLIKDFLEAKTEVLLKNSLVFWSKRCHQKDISKLTDL